MPAKQYMQQVHQPVGMGVDVLALLNINLPPYNTPVPGAFYNPWMQHVMGATATLFDLSALLPWGLVHRGRRLLVHLIPAAPVVAGGDNVSMEMLLREQPDSGLLQSRLGATNPFSAQCRLGQKLGNIAINVVWWCLLHAVLWSSPYSLLGSSTVWGCRRDHANFICCLYCPVHSPEFIYSSPFTLGLEKGIFNSFWTEILCMDFIALHASINSLSQHPCEINWFLFFFIVER